MKKIHTNVRLEEDLYKVLVNQAKKEDRSFSSMLRVIIKFWILHGYNARKAK